MTGIKCGTGTAYPSGTSKFTPVFLIVLMGFVLFKLLPFMFLVLCRDDRLDFRLKTMQFVFTLICFVGGSCFICYLYLFMYTGVQHDFHVG